MYKPINFVLLSCALVTAIAPRTMAQEREPGWTEWRPHIEGEAQTYSAGFSNMQLGGHMDFEYSCETKAAEAQTQPEFFYRLNDLVEVMGMGEVQYKCTIHDQLFTTYRIPAVKADLNYPVCLEVNTDVGNGIRLRQDRNLEAPIVGSLSNGSQFYLSSVPALTATDARGRLWLYLEQKEYKGWASISEKLGAPINFQLCS